jgi:signal transduction histidine kinase
MQAEVVLERLRIIQGVTEAALAHLGLDDLLGTLLDRIVESLEVDTAAVLLLDGPGSEVLVARAAKGIEEEVEQGMRIPVGKGFAGEIAATRKPVVLSDVEHTDVMNPVLQAKGIRSMAGVPLMIEQHVLGVLHVGSLHRREFRQPDVQLLQIVADRVSLAVEHTRLIETVQIARHEAEVAEATVKARDEFLSVAAHELKTPLTSLRLASQTVLRRIEQGSALDPVALQRALRTVDQQTDRLSRLITQLLETVRSQAGKLELDGRPTDLVELARRGIEHLQNQTSRHDLVLRAAGPVWAEIDAIRFEQVIVNLLDNAIKFSPGGGPIEVEVGQAAPNLVRLSIRDHGLGVPPEHRDRLFERFYRAHGGDHRSGMGLGLYITREIVEMHGGHIEAVFPPDGGTQFVVELPAGEAASESQGVA